jgi:hypothetical protein
MVPLCGKNREKLKILSNVDDAMITWTFMNIIFDVIIKAQHQHLKPQVIKVLELQAFEGLGQMVIPNSLLLVQK